MAMKSLRAARSRRGTATVELAVCLPVLVLLVLAMIEAANMIYLKQALTSAAQVSARALVEQDAVTADAELACRNFLDSRNIRGYALTITPADFETTNRGSTIAASVTAPCSANSYGPSWFFGGRTMTVEVTMAREAGPIGEPSTPAPTAPTGRRGGRPTDRGGQGKSPSR